MARYFRTPDYYSPDTYIDYSVLSDKPVDDYSEARLPEGRITVRRGHFSPNFEGAADMSPSWQYTETHSDSEPTELFTHHPAEISGAFTHSTLRPHMIKLATMAALDNPGLRSAYDLSRHSARLSKKGVSMGLIAPHPYNPTSEVSNNYDFDDFNQTVALDDIIPEDDGSMPYHGMRFDPKHEVPDVEMKNISHQMRHMLKNARNRPHMSPQFDVHQHMEKIPGVDW